MKLRSAVVGAMALCCLFFCSCEFETATSIIPEPSQFDFGFVGEWQMPPDETTDQDSSLRIEANAKKKGVYDVFEVTADKKPWIQFTTCRLGSTNTALVEIDTGMGPRFGGQGRFYYVFASVERDVLSIERIDGEKLIALLKTTKTTSVIDRGILFTEITAESDELRKLMIENRKKIISKDTILLNRAAQRK